MPAGGVGRSNVADAALGGAANTRATDEAGPPPADLVELGVVRGAYGVKGWVKVRPHSPEATVLQQVRRWWLGGDGVRPVHVSALRRHGDWLLAKWPGCETREQAEQFRGWRVSVSRAEFPTPGQGEVYWVDLVGAVVVNRSGEELGVVDEVSSNGAQELLQVRRGERTLLIPIVDRHVDEIDLAQRRIRVDWEADW